MNCRLIAVLLLVSAAHAQSSKDLRIAGPLPAGDVLIIGFLGGWERWDNGHRGVRKLALRLREFPGVHVETIGNRRRALALEAVRRALDANGNKVIDPEERSTARIILYGQSFGGAAVVKLARELENLDVPVNLTIQIDSVGRDDEIIPANVAMAANLYQGDRFTIRGQSVIRPLDPSRTRVIENTRYGYSGSRPGMRPESWPRRTFGGSHAAMEADPAVWSRVEQLILQTIAGTKLQ